MLVETIIAAGCLIGIEVFFRKDLLETNMLVSDLDLNAQV